MDSSSVCGASAHHMDLPAEVGGAGSQSLVHGPSTSTGTRTTVDPTVKVSSVVSPVPGSTAYCVLKLHVPPTLLGWSATKSVNVKTTCPASFATALATVTPSALSRSNDAAPNQRSSGGSWRLKVSPGCELSGTDH